MIGFICVMHKCKDCERNTFNLINRFINSLFRFVKKDFKLYLFDNASDEKYYHPFSKNFLLAQQIKYTYIEDQMIRGLAGPYNDGIKMAVEDNCDLIVLINDDIVLNPSINKFLNIVENHPAKDVGLYGPLSNGLHKKSHQLAKRAGKGIREITNIKGQFGNINGFIMAFTPQFYHKFKLPNGDFCDMSKIWGGGEEILQARMRQNGGRMFIVKDCWVNHKRISGWAKFKNAR